MSGWWVNNRGEQLGPILDDQLIELFKSGRIARDAVVAADGTSAWIPVVDAPPIATLVAGRSSGPSTRTIALAAVAIGVVAAVAMVIANIQGDRARERERERVARELQKMHEEEAAAEASASAKKPAMTWPPPITSPVAQEPTVKWGGGAPAANAPTCKSLSPSGVRGPCQAAVKDKLLVPSSGKFGWHEPDPVETTPCVYVYASTVKAKNAFGQPVEHSFTCTVDAAKDTIKVTLD